MNIFNFFKKDPMKEANKKLAEITIPKGEDDIAAGAKELMDILNTTIDEEKARLIFLKSIAISRIAKDFDKERLIFHLDGYCLQFFTDDQVDKFYKYLIALKIAMETSQKSPSDLKKKDDRYYFLQ